MTEEEFIKDIVETYKYMSFMHGVVCLILLVAFGVWIFHSAWALILLVPLFVFASDWQTSRNRANFIKFYLGE